MTDVGSRHAHEATVAGRWKALHHPLRRGAAARPQMAGAVGPEAGVLAVVLQALPVSVREAGRVVVLAGGEAAGADHGLKLEGGGG